MYFGKQREIIVDNYKKAFNSISRDETQSISFTYIFINLGITIQKGYYRTILKVWHQV